MRLILSLILALPLAAQLDIPLMSKRPGLSRSALAAGVQAGSTNLLLHSGDFSNAAWTKFQTTATANKITENAATSTHGAYQVAVAASVTGSVYTNALSVKQDGERAWVFVNLAGSAYSNTKYGAWVNLTTGALGTISAGTSAVIASEGDGWYRVSVSKATVADGVVSCEVWIANADNSITYTGDNASGVLVRKAQLNKGPAALPYVATTDLQSIASTLPGTATLVRGANTGASTDDPTVSLAGWTFDSGDRVSGLPAKGANWTTTNCSGVECYTLTSAGTEYINGVARRNLLRWSEGLDNAAWVKSGNLATVTANGAEWVIAADAGVRGDVLQSVSGVSVGQTYSFTFRLRRGTGSGRNFFLLIQEYNGESFLAQTATAITPAVDATDYTATHTLNQATVNKITVVLRLDNGGTADTIIATRAALSLGSTALEYQKTTDSREWALETVGNYVGLLTGFYRWDRVLGPGEVLNNYRAWLKPRINSVGNTLP